MDAGSVVLAWLILLLVGIAVPAFLTWLAAALVTSARGRSRRTAAVRIAVAIAALVTVAALVYLWSANAYFTGVYLLATLVSAIVTAVVVAIRTAGTADRRATLAAVVFAIAYAGALVAITYLPSEVEHARWDDCAAPKAVAALERYRAALGGYPAKFWDIESSPFGSRFEPEPYCCTSLEPGGCYVNVATNWLYTRSGGGYTLGYWRHYPVVGARLCRHASDSPGWACAWNDWAPFAPPP